MRFIALAENRIEPGIQVYIPFCAAVKWIWSGGEGNRKWNLTNMNFDKDRSERGI